MHSKYIIFTPLIPMKNSGICPACRWHEVLIQRYPFLSNKELEIIIFYISAQKDFVFTMAHQGKSVRIYSSEIKFFFLAN